MGNVEHSPRIVTDSGAHIGLLTPLEATILKLIVTGTTNQQIADKMGIPQDMVEAHISKISRKINTPNSFQAALWAAKHLWEDQEL